jgi:SMODS and SLOG-associating 2TM effector domain 1/Protein of unknown function (DUF4231)
VAVAARHRLVVLGRPEDGGDARLLAGSVPAALELAGAAALDGADGRGDVGVLFGNADDDRLSALELADRGRTVFVVDREADALRRRLREPPSLLGRLLHRPRRSPAMDLVVRRLAEHEHVRVVSPDVYPHSFVRQLAWELSTDSALKEAWTLVGAYDAGAVRHRRQYERFQLWILLLGLAATLLAVLHESTDLRAAQAPVHWLVVALPIVVATLIALANRRAAGKTWVQLRGAAEAVKQEIYRYRTGTGRYERPRERADVDAPAATLVARLSAIGDLLMQTEVSSAAVPDYRGELPPRYAASSDDDGLSTLAPDDYLRLRVDDQLAFYRGKVPKLARRREAAILLTLVAGGAGTLLAAAGFELWVGLTTALAGAAIAYLASLQIESTIVAYNQAAWRLDDLRRRWNARPTAARTNDDFAALVDDAESIFSAEHSGWLQQMTDALAKVDADAAQREETPPT